MPIGKIILGCKYMAALKATKSVVTVLWKDGGASCATSWTKKSSGIKMALQQFTVPENKRVLVVSKLIKPGQSIGILRLSLQCLFPVSSAVRCIERQFNGTKKEKDSFLD